MSLIKNIKNDARQKFPDIYIQNNNFKTKIFDRLIGFNFTFVLLSYFLLIFFVAFYTLVINLDFLKFLKLSFDDNVKTFTTAIITLVSMNLFVTNLLLTHLKDERDDLQSIIDKRVNFKFITYLGFAIVLSILLLYFLSPSIGNTELKSNILIFIFSTFIVYIFLLISLYNIVFKFIHKLTRAEIIKSELELEFSRSFYNYYLKTEFKNRYKIFVETKLGFNRYNSFSNNDQSLIGIYKSQKIDRYLNDIYINKLEKQLRQINDTKKFYEPLELDNKLNRNQLYYFLLFSKNPESKLMNCYNISKKTILKENLNNENLDRLLKKIDNNTLLNKHNDLKDNLKSLDEIYTKYNNLN